MTKLAFLINEDASHECIRDIGRLGCVQFTDLNTELTPFQRRYVSGVKRCDELERKVRFFTGEIEKFGLRVEVPTSPAAFMAAGELDGGAEQAPTGGRGSAQKSSQALLESLEAELGQYERQLLELNKFHAKLMAEYNEKIELHEVLSKSQVFFDAVPSSSMLGGGSTVNDGSVISRVTSPLSLGMSGAGGGGDNRFGDSAARLLDEDYGLENHPQNMAGGGGDFAMKFSSVTGVLLEEDRARFERALFRSTRGNCYVRFAEIEQPMTDMSSSGGAQEGAEPVTKTVFIIFFKSKSIEAKVRKICDAFGARRYSVPDPNDMGGQAIDEAIKANRRDIHESRAVLIKNRAVRHRLCAELAGLTTGWLWTALREKSVFHTLNMLKPDVSGMLRGEGWVVASQEETVKELVAAAHSRVALQGAFVVDPMPKPWPTPPTYFKLNAFTQPYQDFVDTYGVPRYKEANPALFTAVTFPFLFGIMYGDIGHGTCLALAGLYLVLSYSDDPKRGEMMGGIYGARYMILMMGCFAIYAGLIYNDCFSLPLSLFKSSWTWSSDEPESGAVANSTCAYGDGSCVYTFGVDPAWHISSNELLFFNSMKMKMSVILGIIQMCVGIFLKGMNARYFGEKLDLWLEVVPMVIFAYGMFGYMIIIIFTKWSVDWQARMYDGTCNPDNGLWDATPSCTDPDSGYTLADVCKHGKNFGLDLGGDSGGCQPPNLITTLINIALAPGSVDEPIYAGQAGVQTTILLLAFLSVPVLLLGKPLAIKYGKKGEHSDGHDNQALVKDDEECFSEGGDHGGDHEEHDFTEIVIHQAIETIEFVLGMVRTPRNSLLSGDLVLSFFLILFARSFFLGGASQVSNTASYLRLWALSLAHTELASVFWEKAMLATIEMKNPVFIFVGYAVFAAVTFAVLLCMDVLECFLHALRLHWVEFQNKFYKADGYKFQPFHIEPILRAAV
jgi:V-type H+-transporting ATPase subunit a